MRFVILVAMVGRRLNIAKYIENKVCHILESITRSIYDETNDDAVTMMTLISTSETVTYLCGSLSYYLPTCG